MEFFDSVRISSEVGRFEAALQWGAKTAPHLPQFDEVIEHQKIWYLACVERTHGPQMAEIQPGY